MNETHTCAHTLNIIMNIYDNVMKRNKYKHEKAHKINNEKKQNKIFIKMKDNSLKNKYHFIIYYIDILQ